VGGGGLGRAGGLLLDGLIVFASADGRLPARVYGLLNGGLLADRGLLVWAGHDDIGLGNGGGDLGRYKRRRSCGSSGQALAHGIVDLGDGAARAGLDSDVGASDDGRGLDDGVATPKVSVFLGTRTVVSGRRRSLWWR